MYRPFQNLAAAVVPVIEQLELRELYSVVAVSASAPAGSVEQGQAVEADFAASSPAAGWSIDWGDGSSDHYKPRRRSATHLYDGLGTYTATIAADGTDGLATLSYTVNNADPLVAIKGAPATGSEGSPIHLSSRVLDAGDPDGRVYGWTLYKDGQHVMLPEGTAITGKTFDFTPADNGNYVARLTVLDGQGGMTSVNSIPMSVTNLAPQGHIAGVPHSTVRDGRTIYLSAQAIDAGVDDTLNYAWSLSRDGTPVDLADSTMVAQTLSHLPNGVYTVGCIVSDGDGGKTVLEPATFEVQTSLPQTVVSIGGVSPSGEEGTQVAAYATVFGPDASDADTYAWTVTKDGRAYPLPNNVDATGSSFAFTPQDNGEYVLNLVVSDDNGIFGKTSQAVTVANAAPVVSVTTLNSGTIHEGDTLRLQGNVIDPGSNDAHALLWTITKDGRAWTPPAGTRTNAGMLSFVAPDNGTYVATLTVDDFDGGEGAGSTTIRVANAAPAAAINGAPQSTEEGSTVSLSSTVTDPGNDAVTYDWSVTKDGSAYPMASTTDLSSANFSFVPNDNGAYVATLKVADSDGGMTMVSTGPIGVANVAPVGRIDGPTSANEGDALKLYAYGADAGTADTLTYTWHASRDGQTITLGSAHTNDAEFDYTPPSPGEYQFTADIRDDDGATTQISQSVSVANVAPFVAVTSPDPMVGLGQTLSYGSAVIDPGNGTMSYAWSVKRNGVAFDLGTGVTTNRSSFSFTPADSGNYIATLVVNDGKGGITSASSGVTSVLSLLAA